MIEISSGSVYVLSICSNGVKWIYIYVQNCLTALRKKNLCIDSSLDDVLATLLVDVEVFQRRNCDLVWFFLLDTCKYTENNM